MGMLKWLKREWTNTRERDRDRNTGPARTPNRNMSDDVATLGDSSQQSDSDDPIRTPEYKRALLQFLERRSLVVPPENTTPDPVDLDQNTNFHESDQDQPPNGNVKTHSPKKINANQANKNSLNSADRVRVNANASDSKTTSSSVNYDKFRIGNNNNPSVFNKRRCSTELSGSNEVAPTDGLPKTRLEERNALFQSDTDTADDANSVDCKNLNLDNGDHHLPYLPPFLSPESSETDEITVDNAVLLNNTTLPFAFHTALQDIQNTRVHIGDRKEFFDALPLIPFGELKWSKSGRATSFGYYCEWHHTTWNHSKVVTRRVKSHCGIKSTEMLASEIKILSTLRHPHILLLMGVTFDTADNIMPIYQHFSSSLYVHIHELLHALSLQQTIRYIKQICEAITLLHKYGIIHSAISSHCILLEEGFHVAKICGLDSSISSATNDMHNCECLRHQWYQWLAPELFQTIPGQITALTDVYSLCLVFWECCFLKVPWKSLSFTQLSDLYNKWKLGITIPDNVLPEPIYNMLVLGLAVNWKQRKLPLPNLLLMLKNMEVQYSTKEEIYFLNSLFTKRDLEDPFVSEINQLNDPLEPSSTLTGTATTPYISDKIPDKPPKRTIHLDEKITFVRTERKQQNRKFNKRGSFSGHNSVPSTPVRTETQDANDVSSRAVSAPASPVCLPKSFRFNANSGDIGNNPPVVDIKRIVRGHELWIENTVKKCFRDSNTQYTRNTAVKPASHRNEIISVPVERPPRNFTNSASSLVTSTSASSPRVARDRTAYSRVPISVRKSVSVRKVMNEELNSFFETSIWRREKIKCISKMRNGSSESSVLQDILNKERLIAHEQKVNTNSSQNQNDSAKSYDKATQTVLIEDTNNKHNRHSKQDTLLFIRDIVEELLGKCAIDANGNDIRNKVQMNINNQTQNEPRSINVIGGTLLHGVFPIKNGPSGQKLLCTFESTVVKSSTNQYIQTVNNYIVDSKTPAIDENCISLSPIIDYSVKSSIESKLELTPDEQYSIKNDPSSFMLDNISDPSRTSVKTYDSSGSDGFRDFEKDSTTISSSSLQNQTFEIPVKANNRPEETTEYSDRNTLSDETNSSSYGGCTLSQRAVYSPIDTYTICENASPFVRRNKRHPNTQSKAAAMGAPNSCFYCGASLDRRSQNGDTASLPDDIAANDGSFFLRRQLRRCRKFRVLSDILSTEDIYIDDDFSGDSLACHMQLSAAPVNYNYLYYDLSFDDGGNGGSLIDNEIMCLLVEEKDL